ncbi:MAG: hypothetical protein H0W86_10490 [Armatimonadetes bacterium]|nr:hypothetical protein [Armatimonadota bacterium]
MIPREHLDFGACVSSGQVFRFKEVGKKWVGVDGSNIIEAIETADGWSVRSCPDPRAWMDLLQMGQNLLQIKRTIADCEPRLTRQLEAYPGLRLLRCQRSDETLFSFLCTPNNNMARIGRMVRELAAYGKEMGEGLFEFPGVGRIAAIPEAELRSKGFGYRAATITKVARELAQRPSGWLDGLRQVPYENAIRALSELPGVGPKLADCVCLFGLHHSQAVPFDVHLWRAATRLYFPAWSGKSLTALRYRSAGSEFRRRFGNTAGWAQQYLFYERIAAAGTPVCNY